MLSGKKPILQAPQAPANEQLFVADFTHYYKNYGATITGLSYRAIKYGPVPANYDNIYLCLPGMVTN